MEDITQKFMERLKELVALGKKKKSILDVQEINDFFNDMELNADQMEKVFDYLEANNIDVLRISEDTEDDVDVDIDIIISDEDDVDVENIDLSVPEGVNRCCIRSGSNHSGSRNCRYHRSFLYRLNYPAYLFLHGSSHQTQIQI